MRKKMTLLLLICVALTGTTACERREMDGQRPQARNISGKQVIDWQALERKKIYFGHQSVGNNILAGIQDILQENQAARIRVVETSSRLNIVAGTLAHSSIGANESPISKIKDFRAKIDNGLGNHADIALFKFCFVDIDSRTDIKAVFETYRDTMADLKARYPGTTFVHCTVPLLRKENASFKAWIKKLLGRGDGFFDNRHNRARNEFNTLLMNEYQGKEPVFDLAGVTSTYPDGGRETFTAGAKQYYALVPEYTDDGGHLNQAGRKVAAEQFLAFLAGIGQI